MRVGGCRWRKGREFVSWSFSLSRLFVLSSLLAFVAHLLVFDTPFPSAIRRLMRTRIIARLSRERPAAPRCSTLLSLLRCPRLSTTRITGTLLPLQDCKEQRRPQWLLSLFASMRSARSLYLLSRDCELSRSFRASGAALSSYKPEKAQAVSKSALFCCRPRTRAMLTIEPMETVQSRTYELMPAKD